MLYEVDNGVSATLHFAENIFSAASSATAASSYFFTNKIDVDLIDRSNQNVLDQNRPLSEDYGQPSNGNCDNTTHTA